VAPPPDAVSPDCPIEAMELPRLLTHFTEKDLVTRPFCADTEDALVRKGKVRAA
jgi:hypothetical protein